MSATLAGTTTGQAFDVNLVIRFFTPGTQTELFRACVPMAANANAFTVYGIPAGTYDVGIKGLNTLSLLAASKVFTEGNTTNIAFGTLLYGDTSGDDYVSPEDYGSLSGNWGKWGPCYGYAGNWLMPDWPTATAGGGASYKLIGGQSV